MSLRCDNSPAVCDDRRLLITSRRREIPSRADKVGQALAVGLLERPSRDLHAGDTADREERRHTEQVNEVDAERGGQNGERTPREGGGGQHH